MGRALVLAYGVVAYALFFATFLYSVGFVGNIVVPKSIDSGTATLSFWPALAVNAALLGLFAVQHSIMARPAFKRWWTRFVPVAMERSTFVLLTNVVLIALFYAWQPMPATVWSLDSAAGRGVALGLCAIGWLVVLLSTFMINHFDLFGLRQSYLYFRGKEWVSLPFRTTALYGYVRHPIMTGFVVAFWATPDMSVGHLVFAVATTGYMLLGIMLEERDLIAHYGELYAVYRRRVPMLIPRRSAPEWESIVSEAEAAGSKAS